MMLVTKVAKMTFGTELEITPEDVVSLCCNKKANKYK